MSLPAGRPRHIKGHFFEERSVHLLIICRLWLLGCIGILIAIPAGERTGGKLHVPGYDGNCNPCVFIGASSVDRFGVSPFCRLTGGHRAFASLFLVGRRLRWIDPCPFLFRGQAEA